MSVWQHSICEACWKERHPEREPVRSAEPKQPKRACCYCGFDHRSGIQVQADPGETPCRGMTGVHREG